MTSRLLLLLAFVCCLQAAVGQQDSEYRDDTEDEEEEVPSTGETRLPELASKPVSVSVREGQDAEFPCSVLHLGEYVILWKKNDNQVLSAGPMRLLKDPRLQFQEDFAMQIRKVKLSDAGTYTCQVSTDPPIELTHTLQVLVPPKVYTEPRSGLVVLRHGAPLELACQALGNPPPVISWTHQGRPLATTGERLAVPEAHRENAGRYECSAANSEGQDQGSLTVTVLYPPEVEAETAWVHGGPGAAAELVCRVRAEPPASVTWSGPGAAQAEQRAEGDRHVLLLRPAALPADYECKANNSLGSARARLEVSGLPPAPSLRGRSASPTSLLFTWTVRSHSPIVEYRLRFRKADNGSRWDEVPVPAGQGQPGATHSARYELSGLDPGQQYEAAVAARNGFGWGRDSAAVALRTAPDTNDVLPAAWPGGLALEQQSDDNEAGEINSGASQVSIQSLATLLLLIAYCGL